MDELEQILEDEKELRRQKLNTFQKAYSIVIKHMQQMDRSDYTKTEHWKNFRIKALEHFSHRCNLCNATEKEATIHIHHKDYDSIGRETFIDVIALCNRCHGTMHFNKSFYTSMNEDDYNEPDRTDIPKSVSKRSIPDERINLYINAMYATKNQDNTCRGYQRISKIAGMKDHEGKKCLGILEELGVIELVGSSYKIIKNKEDIKL